jgi:hypothetical protein
MKPSPLGSKLLSGYAVIFVGIAPLVFATIGFAHGAIELPIANVLLALGVIMFGVRVFLGNWSAVTIFAVLVALHYFGLAATNYWYADAYPPGSRAAAMAMPRMIRGLMFGSVYLWYFLIRKRTRAGFTSVRPQFDANAKPET